MDEKEFEDICYICRRPESKAGRMFQHLYLRRLYAQDDGCGKSV